jgi:hypothetical protein
MAIGKRKSDFFRLPEAKWDAAIGNFVVEERVCTDGEWESVQTNIPNDKFRGVFDLPNLQMGWVGFIKGLGRDMVMAPIGGEYGARPGEKYYEGLRLLIKLDEALDGKVCECVSTLRSIWAKVDKLHDDYLVKLKKHEGHLPAVDVVDVRKEPGRQTPILIPVFKIVGMVPRPLGLPEAGIPIFRPTRKKEVSDESADGGNGGNGSKYERPKPDDGMDLPFDPH